MQFFLLFSLSWWCLLARAAPIVTWVSEPVQPGQTLLVAGGGFDDSCVASFATTSSVPSSHADAAVLPGHATASSLKFTVPLVLAPDVFNVTISCVDGSTSLLVNAARPWWVQGDAGATATPGGWLRLSGLNVAWLSDDAVAARRDARRAARAIRAARTPGALDAALSSLTASRGPLAAAAHGTLRLSPTGGGAPVDLVPETANATQWSVWVSVPASLPAGEYAVSVSNGRGPGEGGLFSELDSFYDPGTPHVSTIVVAPRTPWAVGVWDIAIPSLPAAWPFAANATSDAAVAAALAAAAAAGGGTVRFPRGTYFLTQPLIVPPGVAIEGAGAEDTVLYFAEATPETAPAAYFALDDAAAAAASGGVGAWAVRDLAVVITAFHYHVFSVSNFTDGFALERVTLRANAFFAGNNAGTPGVQTHGRWANWTLEQPGNAIQLNGRNFAILNNDIWSSYNAITSFDSNSKVGCAGTSWPNSCHGATFGHIADNIVHHGGASHFMNQWRQVIYERNVNVGASVIAMGQSLGTGPDGGHDHHVLHADNEVSLVWGNDRCVCGGRGLVQQPCGRSRHSLTPLSSAASS